MKFSRYLLGFLCLVFHSCFTKEDSRRKASAGESEALEKMKNCFQASQSLQKDLSNKKKMEHFYEACEMFLKNLQLTENQKEVLEALGYKSKPIKSRTAFPIDEAEVKHTIQQKDDTLSSKSDKRNVLSEFPENAQANSPRQTQYLQQPMVNQIPSLKEINKENTLDEQFHDHLEEISIPQSRMQQNMHSHHHETRGFDSMKEKFSGSLEGQLLGIDFHHNIPKPKPINSEASLKGNIPKREILQKFQQKFELNLKTQYFSQDSEQYQERKAQNDAEPKGQDRKDETPHFAYHRQYDIRPQETSEFGAYSKENIRQFSSNTQQKTFDALQEVHQNKRRGQKTENNQHLKPQNAKQTSSQFPNRYDEL